MCCSSGHLPWSSKLERYLIIVIVKLADIGTSWLWLPDRSKLRTVMLSAQEMCGKLSTQSGNAAVVLELNEDTPQIVDSAELSKSALKKKRSSIA